MKTRYSMNRHARLGSAMLIPMALLAACGGEGGAEALARAKRYAEPPPPQVSTDEVSIEGQPHSLMVKDGESAMFNVTGVMGGTDVPLRYQWRRNGVDIRGADQPYLILPGASLADDQAEYSVVVSNGANQAVSQPGVLGVIGAGAELPWR